MRDDPDALAAAAQPRPKHPVLNSVAEGPLLRTPTLITIKGVLFVTAREIISALCVGYVYEFLSPFTSNEPLLLGEKKREVSYLIVANT